MVVEATANPETHETPNISFWQECRKQAEFFNVPAWRIAEEGFLHPTRLPVRTN